MVEFIACNAPHNIFVTLNKVRDDGRKRIYVVNEHAVLSVMENCQKLPKKSFGFVLANESKISQTNAFGVLCHF